MLCASLASAKTVTPQQYGALADGVHDDTEAIQTAINQRGEVLFPEGEYLISKKLIVYSGSTLKGNGNAIIRQTKDTFILFNEHAQSLGGEQDQNIIIDGLRLDGSRVNAKSEYAAGMYFCGVRNLTVRGCKFEQIGGDGIYLGRGGKDTHCERVHICNCTFNNCGRNASNPRQSIAVVFAEDVRIQNCTMNNTRKTSYGVDVEPNKPDEHSSVVVSGCRMIGCGISCGGNKSARKTITVSKCHIDCSGSENATLSVVRTNAKITGNTIISNGNQNGITIVTSPSAVVKKNSIRDASAGVLVTDGADNVVIRGNTIVNCSSGVYVIKSRGAAVLSNILKTKGKGVYIRMESSGTRVEKNKIETETGMDVYSKESADVRVRRNKKLQ